MLNTLKTGEWIKFSWITDGKHYHDVVADFSHLRICLPNDTPIREFLFTVVDGHEGFIRSLTPQEYAFIVGGFKIQGGDNNEREKTHKGV